MIYEETDAIRLMTYNIGGGRRDFGSDMSDVLQVIDDLQPDILGIQEITELKDLDENWYRWTEKISRRLNYGESYYFGPTLSLQDQFHVRKSILVRGIFNDWNGWWQGNALVSRWRFVRLGNPEKPGNPFNIPIFRPSVYLGNRDTDPRYVILSRIDCGNTSPYVLISHLTTLMGETGAGNLPGKVEEAQLIRWRQCQQLIDLIQEELLLKGELVFLMADFNATANEPCISNILVNKGSFVRLKPEDEKATHAKMTSPIDHILVHAGNYRVEYHCWVVDNPTARRASDHLPVVADLRVFDQNSAKVEMKGVGVFQEVE